MSFSDIQRRRRAKLVEEVSISKHQRRPPTLRHFYGHNNDYATLESSKQVEEDYARSTPRRGVRPHLNHVCPVTEKPLIERVSTRDDENSAATSFSYGFDDADDDDSFPAPVTSTRPRQADSEFALLNKEIVNFQKMVADLEQAMEKSGESPEAQWKTKILLRSSEDAQRDTRNRLIDFEETNARRKDGRGQMALRKLRRDFARVQQHYNAAIQAHKKKQNAEVSLFNSKAVEEEKNEEFFDRAMREREIEVNNIHHSMRKVNAIYNDLANMVDGQQEQIDKVSERVEESKSNTRYGMDQIHSAVIGMCAPSESGDSDPWSMHEVYEMATSCKSQVEEGICVDRTTM